MWETVSVLACLFVAVSEPLGWGFRRHSGASCIWVQSSETDLCRGGTVCGGGGCAEPTSDLFRALTDISGDGAVHCELLGIEPRALHKQSLALSSELHTFATPNNFVDNYFEVSK